MADDYDDDYYIGGDVTQAVWRRRYGERISTWSGALLAVVVVGAVVVWGYRLGNRDATAVPVIRAALKPAKVQPEEPPITEAQRQPITSYSASAKKNPPTQLTFAPPPERPAEEDVAMGALQPPKPKPATAGMTEAGPQVSSPPAAGQSTEQSTDQTPMVAQEPDAPALIEPEASTLAPATSPPVPGRPGDLARRMEVARQAVSEDDQLAIAAAASQVQIQLGAFPNRDQTEDEWKRIYRANEDILQGRALVMQTTISGGRRYFRLRAGPFKNRIEAQNVCRALQARGQECIVAVNG